MAQSSEISPEDPIIYTQYNNLRDDILDPTDGHAHDGSTDGGKRISVANFMNIGAGVTGAADGQIFLSGHIKRTSDNAYAVLSQLGSTSLVMDFMTYIHSDNNVNSGDWKSVSHKFTYNVTFTSGQPLVVIPAVCELDYINTVSELRLSDVGVSSAYVKFRWQSSHSGVTNTMRIYLLVVGIPA
jgi:hypothetical protein